MHTALLSLGSNIGDRAGHIRFALDRLTALGHVPEQVSGLYETEPWGNKAQHTFLNIAVRVETPGDAHRLLNDCQAIQAELNTSVKAHWGPREIDIDILFFDEEILQSPGLEIPHPRLAERNFVLIPLLEIAPDWTDPRSGKTVETLYDECRDECEVYLYEQEGTDN